MNFSKFFIALCIYSCATFCDVNTEIFFQELLGKTRNALIKELDKTLSPHPSIDILMITARNEDEKNYYEKILKEQESCLFRNDMQVIVIAGLEEKGECIGSTGSLLRALSEVKKSYELNHAHERDFKDLRIAIIKAGGMARRMIASSIYVNKCLMPMPIVTEHEIFRTTLYFVILNSYYLGQKIASMGFSGLIVLGADQLFLSDADIKEGINYFVDPVSSIEAKRSELIIEDQISREILDFKRKPSDAVRTKIISEEKTKGRSIWAELTNNYIIAGKSNEFSTMYAQYLEGAARINNLITQSSRGYEIFTCDCILPFFMNQEDYIALRLTEHQTPTPNTSDTRENRISFYRSVYSIVTTFFEKRMYLCGNEHVTYREEIMDTIRFYKNGVSPSSAVSKIYQFKDRYQSTILPTASIGEDCCIYQSVIADNVTISDQCAIVDSHLYQGSFIGQDSIVINSTGNITLGAKQLLAMVPIKIDNQEAHALIMVGIDDNPKHVGNAATLFGQSLQSWLRNKNIDLNPSYLDLFTVPIFPVIFGDTIDMDYVSWMTKEGKLPSEIYKKAQHLSLQDIIGLINYTATK